MDRAGARDAASRVAPAADRRPELLARYLRRELGGDALVVDDHRATDGDLGGARRRHQGGPRDAGADRAGDLGRDAAAGTVHTAPAMSISSHVARRTSPDLVAVSPPEREAGSSASSSAEEHDNFLDKPWGVPPWESPPFPPLLLPRRQSRQRRACRRQHQKRVATVGLGVSCSA